MTSVPAWKLWSEPCQSKSQIQTFLNSSSSHKADRLLDLNSLLGLNKPSFCQIKTFFVYSIYLDIYSPGFTIEFIINLAIKERELFYLNMEESSLTLSSIPQ